MAPIVADTSALVSLGTVADSSPNPLDLLLDSHTVVVSEQVVDELAETRLVTTPILLTALVRNDALSPRHPASSWPR